jgi:putative flippase GtrA
MTQKKMAHQGALYFLVGLIQLALDWLVFTGVFGLGFSVISANVCGRVAGASLGFWLNGRVTFSDHKVSSFGISRIVRFLVVWLIISTISTLTLYILSLELSRGWIYYAKPLVEMGCAVLGFFAARLWIYR